MNRKPAAGYLIAVAAAMTVTLIRYLLDDILGNTLIYILYILPVMLAGWYGGLRPALAATVVGGLLSSIYIAPPVGALAFSDPAHALRLVLFLLCGGIVAGLCESLHRTERRRRDAEQAGLATLANIDEVYLGLDREGRVGFLNPAARELFRSHGREPESLLGRRFVGESFPDITGSRADRGIAAVLAGGEPARFETYYAPWGRWFNMRVFPAKNGGAAIHLTDITDLRLTEERLRTAMEGASLTAFEFDLRTGSVTRLADVHEGSPLGLEFQAEAGMATVHPDDRDSLREQLEAALAGETPFFLAEYRTNDNPQREWCWRRTRARVVRAADGTPRLLTGVSMDITEHKRLEEALREADRRKDNYVAMLAHELRNPLAPIRNAVHLLKAEDAPSSQAAFSYEVIDRQSHHMARLLDDLLNVSRIARGTLDLRREQVALRTVIASALETTQPSIAERGHRVDLYLPERDIVLHADPARLAQVFANLIANAARYTPPQGRITITADVDGTHAVATVTDTGMGIPPDQLSSIFELFVQGAHPDGPRSGEGMGIGLALARNLVELHAGTLIAQSDGPGQGSAFVVRLPLGHVGPEELDVRSRAGVGAAESWRILIADDSRDNADSLAELLRLSGHEVTVAYDGEEALAIVPEFRPRAVLLDLGMPRLDGFETCRRLRAMPSDQALIIIALTGWGQAADRELTTAAGFDAHLVKPVDPDEVLSLLSLLGQNNALPA